MPKYSRVNSRLRRGFEDAAKVAHKTVALDAYPTCEFATGKAKLTRSMSADGDLNPAWPALELTLLANPEPILEAIGELVGVRWEKIPDDPADALQSILEQTAGIEIQMEVIAEQLQRLAPPQPKQPSVRKVEPSRQRRVG